MQEEGAALPLLALGESLNPISLLTEGSQMLSLWRGLAEGEGLARSAGCSRVVWLRARPFAREDSPFWGHERRAPWCCPAVNSPCAGREAAGPAPRLTSVFCCRNSELRVRHQGPRMSGPEQHCRGLVPAEEGERAAALLGGRAGTGLGQTGAPFPHRAPAAWLCTCRGTHLSLLCPPQHWIANNLFGLAFSLNGVELLHLNNVSTGCILLGGLFIYDVFWVNGSAPQGGRELQPLAEGMCVASCLFGGSALAEHTLAVRISTSSAQRGAAGTRTESNGGRTWRSKWLRFLISGSGRSGLAGISSGSLAVVGSPCVEHIPSW